MLSTLASFEDVAVDSRGAKFQCSRQDGLEDLAGEAVLLKEWCDTSAWGIRLNRLIMQCVSKSNGTSPRVYTF